VFALHTVLFPFASMRVRVFEPRYLAMLDDVPPEGPFVVVAIRQGQEVGGTYEPARVGVEVAIDVHERGDDGAHHLRVAGRDRVALIAPSSHDPYPVWHVEPYPDEGGAGTDDVEAASRALEGYLRSTGDPVDPTLAIPHDPVAASYVLAAATPGLVPQHQMLLEIASAGQRLVAVRSILRRETALVRALGAGVGGAGIDVSPN